MCVLAATHNHFLCTTACAEQPVLMTLSSAEDAQQLLSFCVL